MQLREFLASKYFDSGTWDIRVEALDRAREQALDLPLTLKRARVVNSLMCELSGGQEEIPKVLNIDYTSSTVDHDTQVVAKLVGYILLQLHKWYCVVPIEDIPICDFPAVISVLENFLYKFLPPSLWDPEIFKFLEFLAKPEPHASTRFPGDAEGSSLDADLYAEDSGDLSGEHEDLTEPRKTSFDMRYKLCRLLLHPTIDRPKDAVPLLETLVMEKTLEHDLMSTAFLRHPQLFLHYMDARILSGYFDQMTQELFSRVFCVVLGDPTFVKNHALDLARQRLLVHLPYVRMQVDQSGEYLMPPGTETIRRIENSFSESALRQMLARANMPPHPVYEVLGGEDWLLARRAKLVTRVERRCGYCKSTSSPGMRLKECTRCGSAYYCSATCQKQHWPEHKAHCSQGKNWKPVLRSLKKTEHKHGAKRCYRWLKWLQLSHPKLLLHGLALHRHPERGQTHIIIREVAYTPEAAELRHRFTTIKCGVFRIDEAMGDIERLLDWPPGDGHEYFEFNIDQANAANRTPVFILSYGREVRAVIDTALFTAAGLPSEALYEPTWRDMINRLGDDPPAPLVLPSGILDAEHVW